MSLHHKLLYALAASLCVCGILILVCPIILDAFNGKSAEEYIDDYVFVMDNSTDYMLEYLEDHATEYNRLLSIQRDRFNPSDDNLRDYYMYSDFSGTGIICYLEIPKCDVRLPVYQGTDDAVLQKGVGHVIGSSIPVGGQGTHALLCGHSGLSSVTIFDDLDKLAFGDLFYITVLNHTLSYMVDSIVTVLPDEVENIAIDGEHDYVTLMTCTPYGVNTHRLLVRGVRVPD